MDSAPRLRNPARAATASLRGYWYQMLYTVVRWLDLDPREELFVEGNEDIDQVVRVGELDQVDRLFLEEQVKFRSSRLDSSTIEPQVFNFLRAFVEHSRKDAAFRGVLRTNARVSSHPRKALMRWVAGRELDLEMLRKELEARVPSDAKESLHYVIANGKLAAFVESVEWATSALGPDDLERELHDRLRNEVTSSPPARTLAILIDRVLRAGTRERIEERSLSSLDRDVLFNDLALEKLVADFRAEPNDPVMSLSAVEHEGLCVSVVVLAAGDVARRAREQLNRRRIELGTESLDAAVTFAALLQAQPDFVAYAASAPTRRGALRACARDVVDQARKRWSMDIAAKDILVGRRFPAGLRARLGNRVPVLRLEETDSLFVDIADELARGLARALAGDRQACEIVRRVGDRLRRFHLLAEGTYFTAANPWHCCPEVAQ